MMLNKILAVFIFAVPVVAGSDAFSISDSEEPIVGASIRVTPDKLVLGQETEAEIQITLLKSFESRAACKNIQVRVNAGEVHQISRIAPGVFSALYQLPDEYYPQFVLISVSAFCNGRTIVGSHAHPLYGSGKVTVQSAPYTKVSLIIAEDSFGPMLTDETGRVEIPVVVRPGIFTGIAGDKVIDLNLPPVKRIVAFAVPPRVEADSEEGVVLWINAIDKFGRPLSTPDFAIHTMRGTVSRIESAAPGIFRTRYMPPSQVGDGTDRITVSSEHDEASREILDIGIYPGRPAQISVTVTPDRYVASSSDPVAVFARVFDKKGNAAAAKLTAVSDFGELVAHASSIPGEYRWTLTLPSHFRGKQQAEVLIYLKTDRHLESTARIDLIPDSPASLAIESPEKPIHADGYTAVPIRVTVRDRHSNPISKLRIQMTSDAGILSPPAEDEPAVYTALYTPPLRRKTDKDVVISAKTDSVRAETSVALTNRTYRAAFTPEVGYFTNVGLIHAPMFSLVADASLWMIVTGLHAGIDFGYYFSKADASTEGVTSVLHAFPIIAFAGYQFILTPRWMIDVTAGLGPFAIRHKLEMSDAYSEKDAAVELSVSASLGIAFRVGPGHAAFRIRYIFARSSKMDSLSGDLGGIALMLGYRLMPI